MTPTRIFASAPGKVILMGEHSAVYGRPALVAALGHRARAEVTAAASDVELDLKTLGLRQRCSWQQLFDYRTEKRRAWRIYAAAAAGQSFDEVRGDDPAHVVKVAMGEVAFDLDLDSLPSVRLEVDSDIPVGSGFGSSAAVAVVVVAACLRFLTGGSKPDQIARLALEVERRQHGHPSGVDHSAVLHGGVLRLDQTDSAARIQVADWVRRDLALFDTGKPAEPTGDVVAAVRRRRASNKRGFSLMLDRMRDRVTEFENLLETPEPPESEIRRVISDFERCLDGLGIVPPNVQESVHKLEQLGAAAKISGAGSLSGSAAGCLLVYRPRGAGSEVDQVLAGYRPVKGAIGVEGLRFEETA
jgi:mevalonate kinase